METFSALEFVERTSKTEEAVAYRVLLLFIFEVWLFCLFVCYDLSHAVLYVGNISFTPRQFVCPGLEMKRAARGQSN